MAAVAEQVRDAEDRQLRDEPLQRRRRGLRHVQGAALELLDALGLRAELAIGEDLDRDAPARLLGQPVGHELHRLVDRVAGVEAVAELQDDAPRPLASLLVPARSKPTNPAVAAPRPTSSPATKKDAARPARPPVVADMVSPVRIGVR